MEGRVWVEGRLVTKAGTAVSSVAPLRVDPGDPYVSRGGLKLAAGLRAWPIDIAGCVCLDVGASTGGFTDCLLQHGALKVYALDVGYGQLHPRLRKDPRVVVFEQTNIRTFDPQRLSEPPNVVTVDTSFISLAKVLPCVAQCLPIGGEVLALVKPQFEVGPHVAKRGVVRDESARQAALLRVQEAAVTGGFLCRASLPAPVRGPKGNVEFLIWLTRPPRES